VRALVFDLSVPKYLAAKSLGGLLPSLYYGRGSCLSLREVAEPALPADDWAKLDIELAGVCGTDIATVFFKLSPALSPFSSFPAVLGHEVTGTLCEVGQAARARGWKEGDRVIVNPFFGCTVRGVSPPCPACAAGKTATCGRLTDGARAPGGCLGFHRELPGGFTDRMVAHVSQLVRIGDRVPAKRAVMTEPLGIAAHAVLQRPPRPGEHVLIVGGGMIGFAVLAALRLLGYDNQVTHRVLLDHQADTARALGATNVSRARDFLDDAVQLTGAKRMKPVLGRDVLQGGGFPLVYECVGLPGSLDDALRATATQGAVVMVGAAGIAPKLDLTWIWSREISLIGSVGYAPEPTHKSRHTLELVADLLTDSRAATLDALVTHTFALEEYRDAIRANVDRHRHRSIKTIFSLKASQGAT
jgi:threonine dehydrogenase-like Zn-dependent dehydrogenase